MHGLALWGAYFMMNNQLELAVVAMVLALNFKQMALYFALPFAFFALAKIWYRKQKTSLAAKLAYTGSQIAWLGIVFVLATCIVWLPWVMETIKDPRGAHGVPSILQRIFPVKRGLFQAHLASFWSVASNFYDVNNKLTQPQQIGAALILTVAASLPSCVALLRQPTNRNFILSLFSVSLAFYLFSFHVHEKQILCPTLFFGLAFPSLKSLFTPFILTAMFNLLELVQREKNETTFIIL
jgi:alpha-1,3-glucosyltransferase